MKQSFADSVLYLGGFYPPNRIARQPLIMLHGHRHLEGCREVSPGIYTGGESLHGVPESWRVLAQCPVDLWVSRHSQTIKAMQEGHQSHGPKLPGSVELKAIRAYTSSLHC